MTVTIQAALQLSKRAVTPKSPLINMHDQYGKIPTNP